MDEPMIHDQVQPPDLSEEQINQLLILQQQGQLNPEQMMLLQEQVRKLHAYK